MINKCVRYKRLCLYKCCHHRMSFRIGNGNGNGNLFLEFLRGVGGRTSDGAKIDEILDTWSDQKLEDDHEYIQWLFPKIQPSGAQPQTPHLSIKERDAISNDVAAMTNFQRGFHRILSFYGLIETSNGVIVVNRVVKPFVIIRGRTTSTISLLNEGNHNTMRMTRILVSLRLFGLHAQARHLLNCLANLVLDANIHSYALIGPTPDATKRAAYDYWEQAATAPMNELKRL